VSLTKSERSLGHRLRNTPSTGDSYLEPTVCIGALLTESCSLLGADIENVLDCVRAGINGSYSAGHPS